MEMPLRQLRVGAARLSGTRAVHSLSAGRALVCGPVQSQTCLSRFPTTTVSERQVGVGVGGQARFSSSSAAAAAGAVATQFTEGLEISEELLDASLRAEDRKPLMLRLSQICNEFEATTPESQVEISLLEAILHYTSAGGEDESVVERFSSFLIENDGHPLGLLFLAVCKSSDPATVEIMVDEFMEGAEEGMDWTLARPGMVSHAAAELARAEEANQGSALRLLRLVRDQYPDDLRSASYLAALEWAISERESLFGLQAEGEDGGVDSVKEASAYLQEALSSIHTAVMGDLKAASGCVEDAYQTIMSLPGAWGDLEAYDDHIVDNAKALRRATKGTLDPVLSYLRHISAQHFDNVLLLDAAFQAEPLPIRLAIAESVSHFHSQLGSVLMGELCREGGRRRSPEEVDWLEKGEIPVVDERDNGEMDGKQWDRITQGHLMFRYGCQLGLMSEFEQATRILGADYVHEDQMKGANDLLQGHWLVRGRIGELLTRQELSEGVIFLSQAVELEPMAVDYRLELADMAGKDGVNSMQRKVLEEGCRPEIAARLSDADLARSITALLRVPGLKEKERYRLANALTPTERQVVSDIVAHELETIEPERGWLGSHIHEIRTEWHPLKDKWVWLGFLLLGGMVFEEVAGYFRYHKFVWSILDIPRKPITEAPLI